MTRLIALSFVVVNGLVVDCFMVRPRTKCSRSSAISVAFCTMAAPDSTNRRTHLSLEERMTKPKTKPSEVSKDDLWPRDAFA
jgi:hypothetical protein